MYFPLKGSLIRHAFIFMLFCFLACLREPDAGAQPPPLTKEIKELCNKVIANIYFDLLDLKDTYPALKDFNENVLYENSRGIYTIVYESKKQTSQRRPYVLGITIDKISDETFAPQLGSFQHVFPALGLKLCGHLPRYRLSSEPDINSVIKKYVEWLTDYQQQYLPLKLTIEPSKNLYHVLEEIELEIILKNVSKKHLFVKTLGAKTLFFLFNNEFWGTRPAEYTEGGSRIVLKAGEELRIKFKGDGFPSPRDVNIYCVYNVSVEGVHPYTNIKVKIIE